ncbi:MAG: hypothetical protein M3N11_06795 [Actinomycetota bacterium]|nr:hypothetical protein [Actinomycetota bacterium]
MTGVPGSNLPVGPLDEDGPARSAAQGGVRVAAEGGVAVLTVWGCLDAEVGAAVRAAAEDAVRDRARRLDIDLRQVVGFTVEGAAALRHCRAGGAGLEQGLHYRTGRGPGREALLAAYTPAVHWDNDVEPAHP